MSDGVIVGVDVGGTFTDVFAIDRKTGRAAIAKVPTTPENQAEGFARGVREGARDAARLETIVHGTTVGTNALLQRRGARGVPFFMIRSDNAGNVSKRFSAGSFQFARLGGACPRCATRIPGCWNATFQGQRTTLPFRPHDRSRLPVV